MLEGYAFRPRAWSLLLAAAGCAAGIALGNWQSGRAEEKRALAAAQKPATLQGVLLPKYTLFLDNKTDRGRPGYHVLQPLRLADGKLVLVNRGWTPAGASRRELPPIRTPAGAVVLEGLRLARLPRAYEPGSGQREGTVWQNVTVAEFAAWSGLVLEPWVFEQHSALDDGLARDWAPASAAVDRHESYALQWYSLAALSIVLWLVLSVQRGKPGA